MKKLFLIIMIFSAFSCQDMMTDEASPNSQVDRDFSLVTKDEGNSYQPDWPVPPDTTYTAKIKAALDELKKDTELNARQIEFTTQSVLILLNRIGEMPKSLVNSEDWPETMRHDPAAAEFGNKLIANLDELHPEFSSCGPVDEIFIYFRCLWSLIKGCIFYGECDTPIAASARACVSHICGY